MKNKIFSLLTLFLVAGAFTSCDNGDDVDGIVQVNKPTMTIDFPNAITVSEGTEIPVTFTLSAPVGHEFPLFVVMDQPNSSADGDDSDVNEPTTSTTFQKTITIPPFVTTYSTVITINSDDAIEGPEVLKFNIGDTRTSAVTFQPLVSTVTINSVVSDELVLDFHFDKTFTGINGYTNSLCELPPVGTPPSGYDIDFLLVDDSNNDTGNLDAQTAACDESMTIKLSDLNLNINPSGLYHVYALLYKKAGLDAILADPLVGVDDFDIPITVDYFKSGGIDPGTFTQEQANWFAATSAEGDFAPVIDVKVTVVNGVRKATIQNTLNTTVIASGKLSNKFKLVSKRKK